MMQTKGGKTGKGLTIFRAMAQGDWLNELPDDLKRSSLSIYGLRSVIKVRRAVLPHGMQVAAQVVTRDRGNCEVFVEATGFKLQHVHTECSCPVGRNCKHAFAALLAGTSRYYLPREDLEDRTDFTIAQQPLRQPAVKAAADAPEVLPPGVPAVPEYYERAAHWPAASLARRERLLGAGV